MARENGQVAPIKKYYIAYFDLLGYKEFFKSKPEQAGELLASIYEAIQNTTAYLQEIWSSPIVGMLGQISIQIKAFSDNILLCLEVHNTTNEYTRFLTFMAIVADIQRNFILQYDLFLRGGITIGTLSFNDDFVFGQGLIDVVALEECAQYPRIIMDQTIVSYVTQPHFVKQEDLRRACEIENRAHANGQVTDEELGFCNSIMPDVEKEKFGTILRDHLILKMPDGAYILNYLYSFDRLINRAAMDQLLELLKILSPSDYQKALRIKPDQKQQQKLMQHKTRIVKQFIEHGNYNDLGTSETEKARIREHVLKKYLWVLSFHNYVCSIYNFPEYTVQSSSTYDPRFMRLAVEILGETT